MYDSKDIEDCYEEIVSLYNDKILFSEDDYEKYALSAVASPIKAMCLHIAHDCNLRCKYCFASTGDFGQGRMLMDYETGKLKLVYHLKITFRINIHIQIYTKIKGHKNVPLARRVYARTPQKDRNIKLLSRTSG